MKTKQNSLNILEIVEGDKNVVILLVYLSRTMLLFYYLILTRDCRLGQFIDQVKSSVISTSMQTIISR